MSSTTAPWASSPTANRRLLAAETRKLRSTRVIWGLMAGMLVLALLALVGQLASDDIFKARASTPEDVRKVFGAAGAGWIFVFALGIVSSAGELRHGTAVQSFLAVPARTPVMVAKVLAVAAAGLVFAGVCCVFVLVVGYPWAHGKASSVSLTDGGIWSVFVGVTLTTSLYGVLGVALGALIRNQMTALLVGIGWFVVAESALVAALPSVAKWMPGGAASALQRSAQDDVLPMGWGGLLFTAYVGAFLVVALVLTRRRDVEA